MAHMHRSDAFLVRFGAFYILSSVVATALIFNAAATRWDIPAWLSENPLLVATILLCALLANTVTPLTNRRKTVMALAGAKPKRFIVFFVPSVQLISCPLSAILVDNLFQAILPFAFACAVTLTAISLFQSRSTHLKGKA